MRRGIQQEKQRDRQQAVSIKTEEYECSDNTCRRLWHTAGRRTAEAVSASGREDGDRAYRGGVPQEQPHRRNSYRDAGGLYR